jgi:hypothetical protein
MPEPISTIAAIGFIAGGTMLTNLNRRNSSVSDSGNYLCAQATHYKSYSTAPVSLNTNRYSALVELDAMLEELMEDGWDGDQAPAITHQTIENVQMFLAALPADMPDPEFAPEPHEGAISLEWYGGYRQVVSVSIHESQRLAFAALQGTDVSNGAYKFDEDHIPLTVLSSIREITATLV